MTKSYQNRPSRSNRDNWNYEMMTRGSTTSLPFPSAPGYKHVVMGDTVQCLQSPLPLITSELCHRDGRRDVNCHVQGTQMPFNTHIKFNCSTCTKDELQQYPHFGFPSGPNCFFGTGGITTITLERNQFSDRLESVQTIEKKMKV